VGCVFAKNLLFFIVMKKSKKHASYPELVITDELRALVRDQMAGYKKMNEIVSEELSRELPQMTPEQSRADFEALCQVWETTLKQYPLPEIFEEQRIQDAIAYRRIFNAFGFYLAKKND